MRRRFLFACALALAAPGSQAESASVEALQAQLRASPHVRALLIERGGKVTFEHYRADTTPATLVNIASVTKSVTSILVGIAADRGLLRVDEPLAAFFPEYAQGKNAGKLERVTLRHLLTLSPGFDRGSLLNDADYNDFMQRFYAPGLLQHALDRPIASQPGSRFVYSNVDAHLVSVALSRRLKMPLKDFARDELFRPLGIETFEWSAGAEGVLEGAAGLRLAAPDLLRVGRMMRDGGTWQGKQIVSKRYAEESTTRHVATDVPPRGSPHLWGYGYLWWTSSTPVDDRPAFAAAGYGGQFIYVVPSLDIVIVVVTQPVSRTVAAQTAVLLREFALPAAR